MFTKFWDMNSGGRQKEKAAIIYIEAPEDEAKLIFYNRFGHNPERVTCTCCGGDYSIDEHRTLAQATAYHRHCKWDTEKKAYVEARETRYGAGRPHIPLATYLKNTKECLVIYAKDIKPEERQGDIPEQGYVWVE